MYTRLLHDGPTSRKLVDFILQDIGSDPHKVAALMEEVFSLEAPRTQRATWVMTHLADDQPCLLLPFTPQLIRSFNKLQKHKGALRSYFRSFHSMLMRTGRELRRQLAQEEMDTLLRQAFDTLIDSNEQSATRVFAMRVVYELSDEHLWVREEFREYLLHECAQKLVKPSFRSAARQLLKQLA